MSVEQLFDSDVDLSFLNPIVLDDRNDIVTVIAIVDAHSVLDPLFFTAHISDDICVYMTLSGKLGWTEIFDVMVL